VSCDLLPLRPAGSGFKSPGGAPCQPFDFRDFVRVMRAGSGRSRFRLFDPAPESSSSPMRSGAATLDLVVCSHHPSTAAHPGFVLHDHRPDHAGQDHVWQSQPRPSLPPASGGDEAASNDAFLDEGTGVVGDHRPEVDRAAEFSGGATHQTSLLSKRARSECRLVWALMLRPTCARTRR
jgi:hypothetical protein